MEVSQVQESIVAINRLVALVVARSAAVVQEQITLQAELEKSAVAVEQVAEVVRSLDPDLGNQIDLIV